MEKKQSKIKYSLRLLLCMFGAVAGLMLCFYIYHQSTLRSRADELLAQKAYVEAQALYDKIGDSEMAEHAFQLFQAQEYNAARIKLQTGDYAGAKAAFQALGGYEDSANMIQACDYLKACQLIDSGSNFEARKILLALDSNYPGREAALERCDSGISRTAMSLARRGSYAKALEAWQSLGGFDNCDKLSFRAQRMLDWLSGDKRYLEPERLYKSAYYPFVYTDDDAYIVVPEKADNNCRFLLYYPGGNDAELNIDFLNYYLMNPAPDTIAVFMRKNGLDHMVNKNSQALEIMDRVAAECGVFADELVVVGSSMGAYVAAHSPRLSMAELAVNVACVLALDAGGDWGYKYALRENECVETAETGAEFYLFESPGVGMNRPAIKIMVRNGVPVTMVACYFDEHERMTYDAMGMGILHWAVGDRTQDCGLDIYTFNKLENE